MILVNNFIADMLSSLYFENFNIFLKIFFNKDNIKELKQKGVYDISSLIYYLERGL